jgi:hypothetical protein
VFSRWLRKSREDCSAELPGVDEFCGAIKVTQNIEAKTTMVLFEFSFFVLGIMI